MNDDLERRLAAYRPDLDGAMRQHRDPRLGSTEPSPGPRRRALVLTAGLAVVALLVGTAVLVNHDDDHAVAPGSTVPATDVASTPAEGDWAFLASFGNETPAPPMPAFWQTMDFGDFRFAVPPGWGVPIAGSVECMLGQSPSGVVLVPSSSEMSCSTGPSGPTTTAAPALPTLTVRRSTGTMADGDTVQVGTLTARRVVDPACSTCAPIYRFADDYEVTVTGDDASRILATFTDSGARRVLQNGTVADTSTWKTVEFDGVAVRVPSSWPTEDLPSTLFHTTDAAGNVNGGGGMVDPGTCNGSLFGNTAQPTAYIGASDLTPSCAVELSWNISPRESVWIRAEASSPDAASGSSIARGSSNGLDVAVLGVDEAQHWSPDIALELVVRTAHDTVLVSLGVGTDASIARAVLHSLHATA